MFDSRHRHSTARRRGVGVFITTVGLPHDNHLVPVFGRTPVTSTLAFVHVYVYEVPCEATGTGGPPQGAAGWSFLRHGGNHDVWSDGDRLEYIPRHTETNEFPGA